MGTGKKQQPQSTLKQRAAPPASNPAPASDMTFPADGPEAAAAVAALRDELQRHKTVSAGVIKQLKREIATLTENARLARAKNVILHGEPSPEHTYRIHQDSAVGVNANITTSDPCLFQSQSESPLPPASVVAPGSNLARASSLLGEDARIHDVDLQAPSATPSPVLNIHSDAPLAASTGASFDPSDERLALALLQVSASASENQSLAKQISKQEAEIADLLKTIDALHSQINDQTAETNVLRGQVAALEDLCASAKNEAKSAKEAERQAAGQIKALEAHASQSAKTIQDLKGKLSVAVQQKDVVAKQLSQAEYEVATKSKSLEARVTQLQELSENREHELQSALAELEKMKQLLQEKDFSIVGLQGIIKNIETSFAKALYNPISSQFSICTVSKQITGFLTPPWQNACIRHVARSFQFFKGDTTVAHAE
ncbi:hypothetical protein HDU83_002953 [Entophlyctis luteolus]|nr:hypothetical protein HDU83_002953 [Entophlyctis luteolus]KAJ3395148.1 hypothetical protein HDU84_002722 [Entophlyctis sp. JEL0112]